LYGFILACLFVTGCKEEASKPSTTAENGTGGGETNAAPDTKGGRTGKVDLGTRRRDRPSLPSDNTDSNAGSGSGEQVSKESTEDRRARRMAQFDTDGDGKISDEERKAARHKRAEDMRNKADANGDGKVTIEEMQNSSGGFRRMDPATVDTNKDGEISVEELETALENRAKQWGQGGRFGRTRDRLRNRMGGGTDTGGAPNGAQP
jgi:hypothetical protein